MDSLSYTVYILHNLSKYILKEGKIAKHFCNFDNPLCAKKGISFSNFTVRFFRPRYG